MIEYGISWQGGWQDGYCRAFDGVIGEQDSNRREGYYYNQCVSSGVQTLNGEKALALARHRHGLSNGDVSRGENQELVIHDFVVKSNVENNFVLYIPGYLKLIKRNCEKSWPTRVNIPENSDLLIKGVGFINIKNSCILETDLDANLLEVRDSLVGRKY